MRLHTNLHATEVRAALGRAQWAGHVTPDVMLDITEHGSRSHDRAFDVSLYTHNKYSLPAGYKDQRGKNMRVRRYKNEGSIGATSAGTAFGRADNSIWTATYHEWGWFMAEVYAADATAKFGNFYKNREHFHEVTESLFRDVNTPFYSPGHP